MSNIKKLINTDRDNIKINMVGENDDYKYFGTAISKSLFFIGFIWLVYVLIISFSEMISRESDQINFTV
jgi:hypothetical protein